MAGRLRVTLDRSVVGTTREARGTVRALGLHRIRQTVEMADSPQARGMVRAVRYLVSVEELPAAPTRTRRARTSESPTAEAPPTDGSPATGGATATDESPATEEAGS